MIPIRVSVELLETFERPLANARPDRLRKRKETAELLVAQLIMLEPLVRHQYVYKVVRNNAQRLNDALIAQGDPSAVVLRRHIEDDLDKLEALLPP